MVITIMKMCSNGLSYDLNPGYSVKLSMGMLYKDVVTINK